jgi:hypothetical protein
MTYFFHNGKIHVLLNKLQKLKSDDYSAIKTAEMVVSVLKETLGLTDTQLARILRHFVYDGKSGFDFSALSQLFKSNHSLKLYCQISPYVIQNLQSCH